jgi:hypothetical protein
VRNLGRGFLLRVIVLCHGVAPSLKRGLTLRIGNNPWKTPSHHSFAQSAGRNLLGLAHEIEVSERPLGKHARMAHSQIDAHNIRRQPKFPLSARLSAIGILSEMAIFRRQSGRSFELYFRALGTIEHMPNWTLTSFS